MNTFKLLITSILLIFLNTVNGQSGFKYGALGGLQFNSAILPDLERNENISSVLDGDDVVKGVPQYAKITLNYRLGGFAKYEDGFGFSQLDVSYSTAKIYKEVTFEGGYFGDYTVTALDRKYSYVDVHASYNVYVSKNHKLYLGLGGGPSFLVTYSGREEPEAQNWNAFLNLGVAFNENVSLQTKFQLGINEVYKDSYIHHIMLPLTLSVSF